ALGVQRVEGQAALARARDAGDHHELAGGDGDVDVLEVVDADAPGNDGFGHGPLRVARPHGAALRGGHKGAIIASTRASSSPLTFIRGTRSGTSPLPPPDARLAQAERVLEGRALLAQ